MKSNAILQLAGAGVVLALASSCGTTGQQPTAGQPNPYGGNWSQSDADYVQVTPTGQGGGNPGNPYAAYQGGGQPGGGNGASFGSYSDYSSYNQASGGGGQAYAAPAPAPAPSYSAPAYSPPPAASGRTYTVQKGDTLYRISRNHGTSVDAVMSANNLVSTNIHPGDVLRIP